MQLSHKMHTHLSERRYHTAGEGEEAEQQLVHQSLPRAQGFEGMQQTAGVVLSMLEVTRI